MEIKYRKCNQYGESKWTEIEVKNEGTVIKFDVSGTEERDLAEHLIEVGMYLMSDSDNLIELLKNSGYWDSITEVVTEELES